MRKITFLALGLAVLTGISCKENKETAGTSTMVSSKELNPEKLDELGKRYLELGRFSGSILVAENGEVVYHEFFGRADYETQEAFSDNSIFSLGPFSEFISNDAGQELTSEAIKDSLEVELKKATEAFIQKAGLEHTFLQTEVPQNAVTGYVHSIGPDGPKTEPVAHGKELQLWTTAKDLRKLIAGVAKDSLIQDGYYESGGFNYAIRKKGDLSVIVLSNRRHPAAGEMAKSIANLWQRLPYQLPLARKETKVSSALLQEYAGVYTLAPGANLEVLAENDSLFILMGPQKTYLKPQSENQFYMDNSEAAIRFEKDSTGKVASAVLLDGFLEGRSIPRKRE